jgi:hypothetical protein
MSELSSHGYNLADHRTQDYIAIGAMGRRQSAAVGLAAAAGAVVEHGTRDRLLVGEQASRIAFEASHDMINTASGVTYSCLMMTST